MASVFLSASLYIYASYFGVDDAAGRIYAWLFIVIRNVSTKFQLAPSCCALDLDCIFSFILRFFPHSRFRSII
jgi:hypothetical protein